jgi:putative lipoprotein
MARRPLFLSLACIVFLLVAVPLRSQDAMGKISGVVLYRQRIALPPDAIVEVILEDVLTPDAPAKVIARQRISTGGKQVPIPFNLFYQTSAIMPEHHYQIRARIEQGGRLLFASTRPYPVFDGGEAPGNVEIMVDQAPLSSEQHSGHVALEGTYWMLIELYGEPIEPASGPNEVHIELNAAGKTFAGSDGCNRLVGSYMTNGDELHFRSLASTLIACVPPIGVQEQSVNKALGETVRFRIEGETLDLSDGHETVARFQARPAK